MMAETKAKAEIKIPFEVVDDPDPDPPLAVPSVSEHSAPDLSALMLQFFLVASFEQSGHL